MSKAYAQKQFLCVQMQAMFRHAEIVSGGYKLRGTQVGIERTPEEEKERAEGKFHPIRFRDMTDEEKLADTLSIFRNQINRMHELCEYIGTGSEEDC